MQFRKPLISFAMFQKSSGATVVPMRRPDHRGHPKSSLGRFRGSLCRRKPTLGLVSLGLKANFIFIYLIDPNEPYATANYYQWFDADLNVLDDVRRLRDLTSKACFSGTWRMPAAHTGIPKQRCETTTAQQPSCSASRYRAIVKRNSSHL